MGRKRLRLRALIDALAHDHPHVHDPHELIAAGGVLVDGFVRTNPRSLVADGARIALRREQPLRGETKLRAALDAFAPSVAERTAMDVGAAAGGFTRVLLEAGARRVYAVDAGHGQLLGSLRQDPRVVNLEATNLGELDRTLVPETIDFVTVDLSYLPLHLAVPQLERVEIAGDADAIALVKPQFELGLSAPPQRGGELRDAVVPARAAFDEGRWSVAGVVECPALGARGAREFLLHARRVRSEP